MMPGKYDLKLYRGDSYQWQFKLWKDDNRTDPVILTGAIVKAEIRDKPSGVKIVPLPCTVTTPNIINMSMLPGLYAQCPLKGVWDLQITFTDGQVQTAIAGVVVVTADVTDSG